MLEKLVLSQDSFDLNLDDLYNTFQSAYRPDNSTEPAHMKIVNCLFLSLIKGNISVLALLGFSSAFDTIDLSILVHRLHIRTISVRKPPLKVLKYLFELQIQYITAVRFVRNAMTM